jgi:hypothetical protein
LHQIGWRCDVSKSPDEIDALLLRIRTMKWQAVTVMSSSSSGLAREEAAALFATLHAIESAMRNGPASESITAVRERIDTLGRLRDHEPVRVAGPTVD